MSMRPRPVTATVTKPKWMEPQVFRPRSASLESSGSTASLTSVLDHDSYISPDASDDSDWASDKENVQKNDEEKREEEKEYYLDRKAIERKLAEYDESSCQVLTESEDSPDIKLSPWEKWLIAKTKSERNSRKQKLLAKKEIIEKHEEEKVNKERMKEKAEENRKKWLEEKQNREQLRKKMEKKRINTEHELKAEQDRDVKEKSERVFKKWMTEKKRETRKKDKEDYQKMKDEEMKQEEKQKKAEEKYKEWFLKAANRPKSVSNSFGYTSGKLTGYHDTSAYPAPTFCNPIPWHHNPIPKQKLEKNKTKAKPSKGKNYVWNPNKYF